MKLTLKAEDKQVLERWLTSRTTDAKQKQRARIVLMTADGLPTAELMEKLGVTNPTLNLWRRRYLEAGIQGLVKGRTRPPRIPPLPQEKVQEILSLTLTGKPAAATHWSCRTLAEQTGVSRMSVNRIWREHGLKPHQVKGFKVSRDPRFAEKLKDVVGL